ncbi:CapA family protein [Ructibacterium gallinarum]|uniref:CapA family protein n=1 Tax=Ructibacterium gallinarum TaxID=2779355 RepID=A0A9D5LYR2_9FIRM|nr:CapA family protein [Ructibacterium gallinarum]MBE5038916.1 CapA family protein [Ructibacterium gallinarum]
MRKIGIAGLAVLLLVMLSGCGGEIPASGDMDMQTRQEAQAENTQRQITISCAGDCTLGTDVSFGGRTLPVEAEAQGNDYSWFFRNVKPIFASDDLTIVNMEGTLTTGGSREDKTFAFRGDPAYVNILTKGSVEAVTLANNHSRDYGEISFTDTKKYLEEAGITWFENLNTAVKEVKGVKVGLIGLYALNGTAESNLPKAMEQVKQEGAELIVVQVHWGVEGSTVPEQSQIALAHAAVDAGADLVIGHHPHVMQGIEEYRGRMIVYSMGNFCFGGNQNPRDKDTMIYQQTFTLRDGKVQDKLDYVVYPCSISSESNRNNYQPTPAEGSEKERIQKKIQQLSDEVGTLTVKFAQDQETGEAANPMEEDASPEQKDSMIL